MEERAAVLGRLYLLRHISSRAECKAFIASRDIISQLLIMQYCSAWQPLYSPKTLVIKSQESYSLNQQGIYQELKGK